MFALFHPRALRDHNHDDDDDEDEDEDDADDAEDVDEDDDDEDEYEDKGNEKSPFLQFSTPVHSSISNFR